MHKRRLSTRSSKRLDEKLEQISLLNPPKQNRILIEEEFENKKDLRRKSTRSITDNAEAQELRIKELEGKLEALENSN